MSKQLGGGIELRGGWSQGPAQNNKTDTPPPHRPEQRRAYELECRAEDDGNLVQIDGYAAVFDVASGPILEAWGIEEVMKSGAFSKTIGEADVRALFNHDADMVIARAKPPAGFLPTLELEEDGTGLMFKASGDTRISYVNDLAVSISRGDISQASFAFVPVQERWTDRGKDEPLLREILEVKLYDVSPVTYPAYEQTSIWLTPRSIEQIAELEAKGNGHAQRLMDLLNDTQGDQEPRANEHSTEPDPQAGHHSDEPPTDSHSEEAQEGKTETVPLSLARAQIELARRMGGNDERNRDEAAS